MTSPFPVARLGSLMRETGGSSRLTVAVIDGPIVREHPDFAGSQIKSLAANIPASCRRRDSLACRHGTLIFGILAAGRDSKFPGLCPGVSFLVRPIFCEEGMPGQTCPVVTPQNLAAAIHAVIEGGAHIINLSLGLASSAIEQHPDLDDAFDLAMRRGVLVIGAAGNQHRVGNLPLMKHPWVIPVIACDNAGRAAPVSNIGVSVGRRGLMAPGIDIPGPAADGGHSRMSGTSMATPFVTGTAALLWSVFPDASAAAIRQALVLPGVARTNILPPLLDAEASRAFLAPARRFG